METINLNLIPTGARPVLHASQYDKGRQFRANLFDGSAVYTLTGAETLSIAVRKPDGHVVTEGITNTSDSYVIIETTEQMTACAGDSFAEVKIEEGGDLLGTLNLILAVEQSPEAGGDPSESFIYNLETQIADAVADQYDSNAVIFDAAPTAGHGVGYAVTSEGVLAAITTDLDDLTDVDTTAPAQGEALVWDGTKWVNGTVSTVGNLDDLSDVDTTGKQEGDSLRYIGGEWKAKPTTVEMTQAEYDAIVDFTPYANTHIVITDAPNLNPTASDIEYSSGVSVADKLDEMPNPVKRATLNGTTDGNGNITLSSYAVADYMVFGANKFRDSTNNVIAYCSIARTATNDYFMVHFTDISNANLTNTALNFEIFFVEV
ncbi:MAG: hypothetical protein J6T65_11325 [Clostridia bacterium]|nr:hypothetical protein [Clostridia bacterium]